ncbi:MAG: OB-fold nucleic acid binding domain-containing protein, partial [Calditrichota bacterium]
MTPPPHRYLKDLQVGDSFTGFYVLRKKELRSRRDGLPYLHLEFGDRSGRLRANIWDDAERLYHELEEEGIVKLQGMIETYQGQPQIVARRLRRAQPDDEFNSDNFLPVSSLDPQTALS